MATQTERRADTGTETAAGGSGPQATGRRSSGETPGRVRGIALTVLTWVIALAFFFPVFGWC